MFLIRDAFENEIRQILGETYEAIDLTDEDVVILGSHGILIAGPLAKQQVKYLVAACSASLLESPLVEFMEGFTQTLLLSCLGRVPTGDDACCIPGASIPSSICT